MERDNSQPSSSDSQTPFDITLRWIKAREAWHRFVGFPNIEAQDGEVRLSIPGVESANGHTQTIVFAYRSEPSADQISTIKDLPGTAQVVDRATRLAAATETAVQLLAKHGICTKEAEHLVSALRSRPDLPATADNKAAWTVQRQLGILQHAISQGALPDDEDLRERRSFWHHKLAAVRTEQGLARLEGHVEQLLAQRRDPAKELALLNAFQRESEHELELVGFLPIRRDQGDDPISTCRRWLALVAFGMRHYAHAVGGAAAEHTTFAADASPSASREGQPPSIAYEWATALRQATEALKPLAEKAGFTAGERKPAVVLTQQIDDLIKGDTADLEGSFREVRILVDEILRKALGQHHAVALRMHRTVLSIKQDITQLVHLMNGADLGIGLLCLDHYLRVNSSRELEAGPGRHQDVEWRATTASLRSHLEEVDTLLNSRFGANSQQLRDGLLLAGRSTCAIATLRSSSHHILVLAVARLLVAPEADGAAPPEAIETLGALPSTEVAARVIRQHVARAILASGWPPDSTPELEREFAQLLAAHQPIGGLGGGSAEPKRTARSGKKGAASTPVSDPKTRDIQAVKLAQRWDSEQRIWTQRVLARELGVVAYQLFGRKGKGGPYRCPTLHEYWRQKKAEKAQRQDNLRQRNRTRISEEEDETDL